jgi:hypothetical protein
VSTDWIKMRVDLREDPSVFRLAKLTKLDRLSVVGRLWAFWSWADKHAIEGHIDGADAADVDEIADKKGFAEALHAVGWLEIGDGFVAIPKHDRHTGESAKERSLKNARQARWRQSRGGDVDAQPSTQSDAQPSTQPSTREEKRREEKEKDIPPAPRVPPWVPPAWIPVDAWTAFIAMRKAKGKRAPFTDAARDGIVAALDKLRAAGHDPGAVLQESVVNGWSGVFAPKVQPLRPVKVDNSDLFRRGSA